MESIDSEFQVLNKCAKSEQREQLVRVMNKLKDEWTQLLNYCRFVSDSRLRDKLK